MNTELTGGTSCLRGSELPITGLLKGKPDSQLVETAQRRVNIEGGEPRVGLLNLSMTDIL